MLMVRLPELFQVVPVPDIKTWPDAPEIQPMMADSESSELPPFAVTVPSVVLPTTASVLNVQVFGSDGETSPVPVIVAKANELRPTNRVNATRPLNINHRIGQSSNSGLP
jgi:hypothetical protein